MNAPDIYKGEQAQLWNGPAGRGWIAAEDAVDTMYRPFEERLARAAAGKARVLDIGCGTGSTSRAIARVASACVGIDISGPMIAAASARAIADNLPARFIAADAQAHVFAPGTFDLLVSRFGVMFFADPARAFANLRSAAAPGAGLHVFAWREAGANGFMTLAERIAAPLLPVLAQRPPRAPDAPGPFAFADPKRVCAVLEQSGWRGIEIAPLDITCTFPQAALAHYLAWMGPVGRILQGADENLRAQVGESLRVAFAPYVRGDDVRFNAACWEVRAHA